MEWRDPAVRAQHGPLFSPELASSELSELVDINYKDRDGMTLLHHAVRVGCWPIARSLLKVQFALADSVTYPTQTPAGWTPLMCLADRPAPKDAFETSEFNKAVHSLVDRMKLSAIKQQATKTGKTALHFMASRGHQNAIDTVLQVVQNKTKQTITTSTKSKMPQMFKNKTKTTQSKPKPKTNNN